jgi:hypothetical protein
MLNDDVEPLSKKLPEVLEIEDFYKCSKLSEHEFFIGCTYQVPVPVPEAIVCQTVTGT